MAMPDDETSILTERPRPRRRGLLSFADRVLPQRMHDDADELRRGRLLVVINTMLVASAAFFAYSSTGEGAWRVQLILGGGAVLASLNVPLLWFIRSSRVPAALTTAELIVVIFACAWIGAGTGDAPLWFMMIAPMLATFLVGPRFGIGAAVVAIAALTFLWFAEQSGVQFNTPAPADKWFHWTASCIGLAVVAAFSSMYESARSQNASLVDQAIRELRDKNFELGGLARQFAAARDAAVEESKRKGEFLDEMRSFAAQQGIALENTRRATARLNETIRAIAASVDTLATSSTASDSTIASMAASATRVTQTVGGLVDGVDETGKALGVLTNAVAAVKAQYDDLRGSATATAASMLAMEESASKVEQNAARTVSLSDAMIKDAERGQDAVRRTLAGVDEIRASARAVGEVIRLLEQRVSAIGAINNVIDEVAVETNVLALNASIIAAQAGERGHGFAVVADQIKALAARTAGSTREISAVIRALQAETQNAVGAIETGDRAVDAGVALSDEAARALEQIVASARQATQEVRGIEQATTAQARRARDVGGAMAEVTRLVSLAVKATAEHTAAVASIETAMKKLSALAPELAEKSAQQAEGGKLARAAIARISEMAKRLSSVQTDQSRASDETLRAIEELQKTQRGQEEALQRLSG